MILIILIAAHFVCDTVFQPPHVSQQKHPLWAKQRAYTQTTWPYVMIGHAATHAFAVYLITNSFLCFLLELWFHAHIDYLKCTGKFGTKHNMHIDQGLHILCKLFYVFVILRGV